MEDQITELAELLSSTSLTDGEFKDADLWEKRVAPITRPFLQAVMERFQDRVREQLGTTVEIRYKREPGEVKKRATTRDSARVVIPVRSGGIKNFNVGIRLGVSDYLENELVWGASWWGKMANVSRVEKRFTETKREGEEVKVVRDMMFGGISCYLIKSLSPSELRSRDEQDLIGEMAADLFDVYERVREVAKKIDEGGVEVDVDDRLSRYFAAQGFHFTPHQLATFYTALKTKGFVILSGLSGTGKTKLAQLFAELMASPETETVGGPRGHFQFVPVRPDWRDSKSLLGYYNPLTGQFESTRFLRFLLQVRDNYRSSLHELKWEADHPNASTLLAEPKALTGSRVRLALTAFDAGGQPVAAGAFEFRVNEGRQLSLPGRMSDLEPFRNAAEIYALELDRVYPHFIILDEMNLARVEYYFADFLSVLESGRDADGWTKEAIALHDFGKSVEDADGDPISPQIRLPPNLYFASTVNVDETTYMFSPKVLDRAFTIEFTEVDFTNYPTEMGEELPEGELIWLRHQLLKDFTRGGRFTIVDKGTIAGFADQHPKYGKHLGSLKALLQPYDLHFAYRIFDEIMAFLDNAKDSPVFAGFAGGLDAVFDTAVLMKVLPKLHGPRGKLEKPLQALLAWALQPDNPDEGWARLKPRLEDEIKKWTKWQESLETEGLEPFLAELNFAYPRTARKVLRMLRSLYTTGFASFA